MLYDSVDAPSNVKYLKGPWCIGIAVTRVEWWIDSCIFKANSVKCKRQTTVFTIVVPVTINIVTFERKIIVMSVPGKYIMIGAIETSNMQARVVL